MRLIKFRSGNGDDDIWINPDHVQAVFAHSQDARKTKIFVGPGDDHYQVFNRVEEVVAALTAPAQATRTEVAQRVLRQGGAQP